MYPFSFLIILFWIINIVNNEPRKAFLIQLTFSLFISVFIETGYFLDSNVVKIEYWQISSILTFITVIPLMSTFYWEKNQFFLYVLTLLISVFFLIIFPIQKPVVVGAGGIYEDVMLGNSPYIEPHFSKFTIFFFSFSIIQAISIQVAFRIFGINDYYYIIHKMSVGAKIIIIIVLFEFILRYWFTGVYDNFITYVFGQSQSTYLTNELRGSSFMLQGLTREGSHLVYSLFTALIVFFTENKISFKNNQNKFFITLCILEVIISMSFSSILIFVMLFLMYFIYRYSDNIKTREVFIFIGITSLIIFILPLILPLFNFADTYYYERFLSSFDDISNIIITNNISTFNDSTTISSTTTRLFSIIDNLSLLKYRPFFGVGIGTTFCHGSTALTVAETGVFGLISYVYFYFFSMPIINKRRIYIIIIIVWLIGNLFVSGSRLMVRMDSFLFFVCIYLLLNNVKILKFNHLLKKKYVSFNSDASLQ
jgi:hypothetical protein